MRSSLFGENLETTSSEVMALQNPRMPKARLGDGAGGATEVLARQGVMVAYQGLTAARCSCSGRPATTTGRPAAMRDDGWRGPALVR